MRRKRCLLLGTAILLCVAITIGAFPGFSASAAEPNDIYYSDVVWGYPGALQFSTYLNNYNVNVHGAMSNVLSEYVETSHFQLSVVGLGLEYGLNWDEFAKYIGDSVGVSNFSETEALDAANRQIAEALFSVDSTTSSAYGLPMKVTGYLKSALSFADNFNEFYQGYDWDALTPEEVREKFPEMLDIAMQHCDGGIIVLNGDLVNALDKFGVLAEIVSDASEVQKFLKALVVSFEMSYAQLDLIQDIIDSQNTNTMLYKGMSRLKNQLKSGYASYFLSTYISGKVYDKVYDFFKDIFEDAVSVSWASALPLDLVCSVFNLMRTVIFDWILDADYSDYTTAVVLYQYSQDFKDAVTEKSLSLVDGFTPQKLEQYESLYMAYLSVNLSALEYYDTLAQHNSTYDKAYLANRREAITKNAQSSSGKYNVFLDYANHAKALCDYVKSVDDELRATFVPNFTTYTMGRNMKLSDKGTNYMDPDTIYCTNGMLQADIYTNSYDLTVPADVKVKLVGDLQVGGYKYNDHARLRVDGELEVTGDVRSSSNYGGLTMDKDGSVLRVGGDTWWYSRGYCETTAGTIIFNGTAKQTVSNLEAYNVEVLNPEGIAYSSLHLHGHYDLHGNPISSTSDTSDPCTYIYEGAGLEPGLENDYQNVYLSENNTSLFKNGETIQADIYSHGYDLTVLADVKAKVVGNLRVEGYYNRVRLRVDGELEVSGKINTLSYNDQYSGGVIMDREDSVLRVGGDVQLYRHYCEMSAGTVIFNGTETQFVYGLEAYNIEVLNPEGIMYGMDNDYEKRGIRLHGHYNLHGNPVCAFNNLPTVYLYEGASLELGPENNYQQIGLLQDNISLFKNGDTIHANLITNGSYFTIPAGVKAKLVGNLIVGGYNNHHSHLQIDGELEVYGNVQSPESYRGTLTMDQDGSVLRVNGDFSIDCTLTAGTVVFNGTEQQTVTKLKACSTVILENESKGGVVFNSAIAVSRLFDHKGNTFTLYNSGRGSTFVDYDGDTMLDHVDPEPTVKAKEITTFEGRTVTVELIDPPDCTNLIFALYRPDGTMIEVYTANTSDATVKQTFSNLASGSKIKVFFLSQEFEPLCKAREFLVH